MFESQLEGAAVASRGGRASRRLGARIVECRGVPRGKKHGRKIETSKTNPFYSRLDFREDKLLFGYCFLSSLKSCRRGFFLPSESVTRKHSVDRNEAVKYKGTKGQKEMTR